MPFLVIYDRGAGYQSTLIVHAPTFFAAALTAASRLETDGLGDIANEPCQVTFIERLPTETDPVTYVPPTDIAVRGTR